MTNSYYRIVDPCGEESIAGKAGYFEICTANTLNVKIIGFDFVKFSLSNVTHLIDGSNCNSFLS